MLCALISDRSHQTASQFPRRYADLHHYFPNKCCAPHDDTSPQTQSRRHPHIEDAFGNIGVSVEFRATASPSAATSRAPSAQHPPLAETKATFFRHFNARRAKTANT